MIERLIQASTERIFALLPRSAAFHGTTSIFAGLIGVGTTHVEQSPFGVRYGKLTDLRAFAGCAATGLPRRYPPKTGSG